MNMIATRNADAVIPVSSAASKIVDKLISSSHAKYMDLETVLPWAMPVDMTTPPKRESTAWLYGTRYWDALDESQKIEALYKETAREVTMFIVLEEVIPPLYIDYAMKHADALPPNVREYLMVFSKEEIVHSLMFRRYLAHKGLAIFDTRSEFYRALIQKMFSASPVGGILITLLVEWGAELNAMYSTQADGVDAMTRDLFRVHHLEEVRHIGFGRQVVESYLAESSPAVRDQTRKLVKQLLDFYIPEFTYSAEIADHTSFEFPIGKDDYAAIREIRNSENNRKINSERFLEMTKWLARIGML
jgi:hypothetical protein